MTAPRLLCVALIGLVLSLTPASAQDEAEANPFGVVEAFWLPDDACELGAGWERIIFSWAQHQPTGPEDWHTLNVDDRWLETARDCNREVVALLKDTPDWATDGLAGPGLPTGLDLPFDDPRNIWGNFVRRAAAYYAERGVDRFIIWNEPDIDRETYGFEFEGSVEDYARLLKVAYLAARDGNPEAKIHVAGVTYWHDVNEGRRLYLDRLFEVLSRDPDAPRFNYYFDALTLHIYFQTDTVYRIVSETRALLESHGIEGKSIWVTELNASPNLDPEWPVERPNWQITLDQQAAFLVQATALALAAGADHVGVYKFYDWNLASGAESFGLVRANGNRRPAFDTWRMVIDRFQNVESASLARSERTAVVRLEQGDGQTLLVAWARTGEPVELFVSSAGPQSQLLDQYGKMMTLLPFDGGYAVVLPGATCNVVDGCPVGGFTTVLMLSGGEIHVEEATLAGRRPLVFE